MILCRTCIHCCAIIGMSCISSNRHSVLSCTMFVSTSPCMVLHRIGDTVGINHKIRYTGLWRNDVLGYRADGFALKPIPTSRGANCRARTREWA